MMGISHADEPFTSVIGYRVRVARNGSHLFHKRSVGHPPGEIRVQAENFGSQKFRLIEVLRFEIGGRSNDSYAGNSVAQRNHPCPMVLLFIEDQRVTWSERCVGISACVENHATELGKHSHLVHITAL